MCIPIAGFIPAPEVIRWPKIETETSNDSNIQLDILPKYIMEHLAKAFSGIEKAIHRHKPLVISRFGKHRICQNLISTLAICVCTAQKSQCARKWYFLLAFEPISALYLP